MGDEGDGVTHVTPEETHEVSDKLFNISTFSNRPFSKMAAENSNKLKVAKIKNVYQH